MQYKKVYLGAWALGSTIHLKELYQALAFQQSPYFSPKEIRAWQEGLQPLSIEYLPEAINSVKGEFENRVAFDVLEDGAIILSKDVEDLQKDVEHLDQFMNTKVRPFWSNLSSKDVALPEIFMKEKIANPILVHVEGALVDELQRIFDAFDAVVYKRITLETGQVWIGERIVVLSDVNIKDGDLIEAVRYLIFARLYELQLKKLLDIQRKLWNRLEGIEHRRYYKSSELPIVRDKALSIQNQATFFRSRSKQMSQFLAWRKQFIDDYLSDHVLTAIFREFFLSLKSTQGYLYELWSMTVTYANGTVQSVSLAYSDSQQRELRTLQKLFLISAVTAVLSLGTFAGSRIITSDAGGKLLSQGVMITWELNSFLFYGTVAVGVSAIIYILFYFVFTRFQQTRHISAKHDDHKKK